MSQGPMRQRLRRFAAIGLVATLIDVAVLVVAARGFGLIVIAADALALVTAGLVSYVLHRVITFAGDPRVRWVHHPWAFVGVAVVAGVIDVAVLRALVVATGWTTVPALVTAKLAAVAIASVVRFVGYRWVLFTDVRADLADRVDRPPAPGEVRLSVVVPAFREADRIAATVARMRAELTAAVGSGGLEIVVVDDGSGDSTAASAEAAGADRVVVLPRNRGKGAAVRAGVTAATGRTVAYTDADLAYAPAQIVTLLEAIEDGWDVVVGSRSHTGTTTVVRARRLRELGGRAINACTHAVLLGRYRDTQCGLKAFRSDVARSLFARTRVDGFAFDVEIFHLVERDRCSLLEVPVRVANTERSTVSAVRDGVRVLVDLARIVRWGRSGVYDVTAEAQAGAAATAPAGAQVVTE